MTLHSPPEYACYAEWNDRSPSLISSSLEGVIAPFPQRQQMEWVDSSMRSRLEAHPLRAQDSPLSCAHLSYKISLPGTFDRAAQKEPRQLASYFVAIGLPKTNGLVELANAETLAPGRMESGGSWTNNNRTLSGSSGNVPSGSIDTGAIPPIPKSACQVRALR